MKTKYCLSCKTAKNETPDNFQRRGDKFRSPCKACMQKIKNRKKPDLIVNKIVNKIETPPVKVTVEMESDDLIDELMASLIVKHNCHFSLSISRSGTAKLSFHGNPQITFKAESAAEVIDMALDR